MGLLLLIAGLILLLAGSSWFAAAATVGWILAIAGGAVLAVEVGIFLAGTVFAAREFRKF